MQHLRLVRGLVVLGLCLGLASTSLAAKGGAAPSDPAAAVVAAARSQLGDVYAWGGNGPDAWDCSGLVYAAWRGAGGVKDVPRVSRDQHAWSVPLPQAQVLPGDLAFFGDPVTHVGLVTKREGETLIMLDAASSRRGVVERVVWRSGIVRFGRVPRPGMPEVKPWTPAPVAPKAAPVKQPLTLPAGTQSVASTAVAQAAAGWARKAVGAPNQGDAVLVQQVWQRAGGPALPASRDQLIAAGRPVDLADARIGDLVVYGPPASHVGVYVGNGLMVDASRKLGKVVLRPVWASATLRLVRLPGA